MGCMGVHEVEHGLRGVVHEVVHGVHRLHWVEHGLHGSAWGCMGVQGVEFFFAGAGKEYTLFKSKFQTHAVFGKQPHKLSHAQVHTIVAVGVAFSLNVAHSRTAANA